MKYKNLTKEQIIISLDRLTRFKSTKEKYQRVFCDILISNLLDPQIKKSDFDILEPEYIKDTAVKILNDSIHLMCADKGSDFTINNILKEYENNTFVNDSYTNVLLENKIDYKTAVNLITEDDVINLKWLKSLSSISYETLAQNREANFYKYPIEKVLLVEGLTEEILLPEFSKFLGYDFNQKGIQIVPAGGKNQVVRMYYELSEQLKLPIFLLLDRDAEDNLNQIKPKLRKNDKIHLVSCGEFEDLLPKSLIVKAVNSHLNNFASITDNELNDSISRVKNLEEIFKEKGLHEFKKAEFAKLVKENINEMNDVSDEIRDIINEIFY